MSVPFVCKSVSKAKKQGTATQNWTLVLYKYYFPFLDKSRRAVLGNLLFCILHSLRGVLLHVTLTLTSMHMPCADVISVINIKHTKKKRETQTFRFVWATSTHVGARDGKDVHVLSIGFVWHTPFSLCEKHSQSSGKKKQSVPSHGHSQTGHGMHTQLSFRLPFNLNLQLYYFTNSEALFRTVRISGNDTEHQLGGRGC